MKHQITQLGQNLIRNYNIPIPIQQQLVAHNIKGVIKFRGVINAPNIIKYRSWRQHTMADNIIRNCSRRPDFKTFSLDDDFITMAELVDAVDKYEGLMRVPRAGGIHGYINGLGVRGELHHLHSPRMTESDMTGTYNLLFLVEYLKLIPEVIGKWMEAKR